MNQTFCKTNSSCISSSKDELISIDLTELQEERLKEFLISQFQDNCVSIEESLSNHHNQLEFLIVHDPSASTLVVSNPSDASKTSVCKLDMTRIPVTRTELLFDGNISSNCSPLGISDVTFRGI